MEFEPTHFQHCNWQPSLINIGPQLDHTNRSTQNYPKQKNTHHNFCDIFNPAAVVICSKTSLLPYIEKKLFRNQISFFPFTKKWMAILLHLVPLASKRFIYTKHLCIICIFPTSHINLLLLDALLKRFYLNEINEEQFWIFENAEKL